MKANIPISPRHGKPMNEPPSPTPGSASATGGDPDGAGLLKRLVLLVSAPGRLGDHLRVRPVWWDVLLLGALFVAISNWVIPPEVWEDFVRAQAMGSGSGPSDGTPPAPGEMIRIFSSVAAPLAWGLFLLLSAGIMTFLFAFILGDEGGFRQYLAGTAHAALLTGAGALLVSPLKVARSDPQLTLSVGTFLQGALDGTFPGAFLNSLDLFGLASWIVMGLLFSRLDERRTAGSAVAVVLGVSLSLVAIVAWFQYRAGS